MSPLPQSSSGSSAVNDTTASNALPFGPWHQTVTLVDAYGKPTSPEMGDLTLDDFNDWALYAIHASINWGSQFGASVIMVALLLVLTKHDKRRSPIFICNVLALILTAVRAMTNVTFYTSEWYNFYTYYTGDDTRVPTSDYATSIIAVITSLLLLICIEISLTLQASVVCATLARPRRIAVRIVSALVALTAVTTRVLLAVWNIKSILGVQLTRSYLPPLTNITLSFSVCFFSMVFCGKLGMAIRNRRRLGLKQFGPMQIIFIMGAQTLIVPGVCSILQFFTNDEIGALSLALVAIFLPLSSVWAASNTDDRNQASRSHDAHHKFLGGLRWKRTPGERPAVALLDCSFSSSSQEPASPSPSSKQTTLTYSTGRTAVDVEGGRRNQTFDVGRAMNKLFP